MPPRLRHEAPLRDVRPIEAPTAAPPPSASTSRPPRSNGCAQAFRERSDPRPSPRWSLTTTMCRCLRTAGTIRRSIPASVRSGRHRQSRRCRRTIARATRLSTSLKASRLDFLFRARPARPTTPPENFDAFWPSERRVGSVDAEVGPEVEGQVQSQPDQAVSVQDVPPESPTPQEPAATADPEVGCRRGHGLHALRRRIDRSRAS